MNFFLLWIMTRLKESGWPKSEGFLRRRKLLIEAAVTAATQDAVRVAITIGASLPETARSIAITFLEEGRPITQGEVDKRIEEAASRGDSKITGLSDIYPQWLRLCSITATDGLNEQHFLWNPSTGGPRYAMEDPEVTKMLVQGATLSGIRCAGCVTV